MPVSWNVWEFHHDILQPGAAAALLHHAGGCAAGDAAVCGAFDGGQCDLPSHVAAQL